MTILATKIDPGIISKLAQDNNTFNPLKVICIIIVTSKFFVESLVSAKTQPKKNPYKTEPREKCNSAKKILLIKIASLVPST